MKLIDLLWKFLETDFVLYALVVAIPVFLFCFYMADRERRMNALIDKWNSIDWSDPDFYVVQCPHCGWFGMSYEADGGESIADTGDYSDIYCPCEGCEGHDFQLPLDELSQKETPFILPVYRKP